MKVDLKFLTSTSLAILVLASQSYADVVIYNPGADDQNVTTYTNNTEVDAITVDANHILLINNGTINDGTPAGGGDIVLIPFGITLGTLENNSTISNANGGFNPVQVTGILSTLDNNGLITTSNSSAVAILLDGQLSNLQNEGGIIESTAGARAIWINQTQAAALTNAGIIRNTNSSNTSTSDAIRVDNDQTQIFTNTGTIIGVNDAIETTSDANFLFSNSGTVTGTNGYALFFDGNSDGTITNSGTLTGGTGAIANTDGAGTGIIIFTNQSGGILNGGITAASNAAHNIDLQGGSVTGDITLNGTTGNIFSLSGDATITGNIDLGNGAAHTVTLSNATVNGRFDFGDTAGTNVSITPGAGTVLGFLNAGSTAIRGEQTTLNMTGAGTLRINGNVVDTIGGDNDVVLDINNGTLDFAGDSVINGSIDSDGAIIDLNTSTVTIGAASDISADSILRLNINGSTNGSLINGAADVGITLQDNSTIMLDSITNIADGQSYTIIDATGAGGGANLTATAANITLNESSARFNFSLQKSGDKLLLVTQSTALNLDSNASSIDNSLDVALASDTELSYALNNISSQSALQTAYKTLDNNIKAANVAGSLAVQSNTHNIIQTRMIEQVKHYISQNVQTGLSAGDVPSFAERHGWVEIFHFRGDQNDRKGFDGYEIKTTGVSAGMDGVVEKNGLDRLLLGVAGTYSNSDSDMNNVVSTVDIDSYQLTLYGAMEKGNYFLYGQIAGLYNDYESSRKVDVGSLERIASADFDGYQVGVNMKGGKSFEWGGTILEPAMILNYTMLHTNDYTESGAGNANLDVQDETYNQLAGGVALAVSKEFAVNGYHFVPQVEVGYTYDLLNEKLETTQSFTGGGADFTTEGLTPARHNGYIQADMKLTSYENWDINLDYRYSARSGFSGHAGSLDIRYQF